MGEELVLDSKLFGWGVGSCLRTARLGLESGFCTHSPNPGLGSRFSSPLPARHARGADEIPSQLPWVLGLKKVTFSIGLYKGEGIF